MKTGQFNDIFLPLGDGLLAVAENLLEDRQGAEDALQELYLRLWKRRDELDRLDNPAAYATTMIKNIALDMLKSRKVRQSDKIDESHNQIGADRSDDVVHKDLLSRTMEIIGTLAPHKREIIIKRILEEKSMEEISAETGHSPLYIRVQLSVARKELKRKMKGII